MDTYTCTSCGKALTITDFTTGSVKQKEGRLYCLNCTVAGKHVTRMACPKCRNVETPLFDGHVYLCRKCGAEIGATDPETMTGPPSAQSPPPRMQTAELPVAAPSSPQKKCPFCAEMIALEAVVCRHCNGSLQGSTAYPPMPDRSPSSALSFLFAAALLLTLGLSGYAVFVQQPAGSRAPEDSTQTIKQELSLLTKPIQEQLSEVEKSLSEVRRTSKESSESVDRIRAARHADATSAGEVRDKVKVTESRLEKVESSMLALEKLLQQQGGSLQQLSGNLNAQAKQVEAQSQVINDASFDDFSKADDKAMEYMKVSNYGRAIKEFDDFIAKHPQSLYRQRAEDKKLLYTNHARDFYNDVIKPKVERDLAASKYDDAIAILDKVNEFGVPELMRLAASKKDSIREQKHSDTESKIVFDRPKPKARPAETEAPSIPSVPKTQDDFSRATTGGAAIPPLPERTDTEPAPRNMQQLIRAIEDDTLSARERKEAVKELADIEHPDAIAALVGATKSSDWTVQLPAAVALGNCKDKSVIPDLIDLLNHKMIPVIAAAHSSLNNITGANLNVNSKQAWDEWLRANGPRMGIPTREKTTVSRSADLPVEKKDQLARKGTNQSVVLAIQAAKNSLIFSCSGLDPQPKIGDVFNVVRENKWIAKVEVTTIGPGIARAVVAQGPADNDTIKINDIVTP